MFSKRKFSFIVCIALIFAFMALVATGLLSSSDTEAQYWTLMPPYNVLWPLWSPVLSPRDPVTGIAVPLVSELTVNTILPIQPGLGSMPACTLVPL